MSLKVHCSIKKEKRKKKERKGKPFLTKHNVVWYHLLPGTVTKVLVLQPHQQIRKFLKNKCKSHTAIFSVTSFVWKQTQSLFRNCDIIYDNIWLEYTYKNVPFLRSTLFHGSVKNYFDWLIPLSPWSADSNSLIFNYIEKRRRQDKLNKI